LGLTGLSAVGLRHEGQEVRAFDPDAITQELAEGRTVFVYFTADWCITCAANERLVLSDDRVQAAFGRGDVAVFKADWTRRDESIRLELARFGRAGVPMYLVYRAGAEDEPIVLPELLNVDLVLEALRPEIQTGRLNGR
jgi:thiol:disulfide interchange protein DsbD